MNKMNINKLKLFLLRLWDRFIFSISKSIGQLFLKLPFLRILKSSLFINRVIQNKIFGLISFTLMVFCWPLFQIRSEILGPKFIALDAVFFYQPSKVFYSLCLLNSGQLKFYAWTEITLDMAFPLSYVFFGVHFLSLLPKDKHIYYLPYYLAMLSTILLGVADFIENILLFNLAYFFPPGNNDLIVPVSLFSGLKWLFGIIVLATIVFIISIKIWEYFFSNIPQQSKSETYS